MEIYKNFTELKHNDGVLYYADEAGRDFYAARDSLERDDIAIVFDPRNGFIHQVIAGGSGLSMRPGKSLLVLRKHEVPDDLSIEDDGKYLVTKSGKIIISPDFFKREKTTRILMADRVISPMTGYAAAGILSDEDKVRFKAWNQYRKALEDVDMTVTDIEWPAKPE